MYRLAGLLFLLALAYRYWDTLARVFLLAYTAAIVAVAANALVRRLPLHRRWAAAALGAVTVAAFAAGLWIGGSAVLAQLRGLAADGRQSRRGCAGERVQARLGVDVELVGARAGAVVREFFADLRGADVVGRARGLLEWLVLPVLVFFGALFALAQPNRLLVPLLRAVPRGRRRAFRRILGPHGTRLLGFIKGQIISIVTVGILATTAFYLLGLPYAFLFGVLNGLAEIVPILGPWAGGIPAVAVAFAVDPAKGLWAAVAVLGVVAARASARHTASPVCSNRVRKRCGMGSAARGGEGDRPGDGPARWGAAPGGRRTPATSMPVPAREPTGRRVGSADHRRSTAASAEAPCPAAAIPAARLRSAA